MENLIKWCLWLLVFGFAAYGLNRWLKKLQDDAWEKRRRIGFQPNPELAESN